MPACMVGNCEFCGRSCMLGRHTEYKLYRIGPDIKSHIRCVPDCGWRLGTKIKVWFAVHKLRKEIYKELD